MMDPLWERVTDGEYNEQILATAHGQVTLFSDRDGERWSYRLGDGEPVDLEATTELAARREVLRGLPRA